VNAREILDDTLIAFVELVVCLTYEACLQANRSHVVWGTHRHAVDTLQALWHRIIFEQSSYLFRPWLCENPDCSNLLPPNWHAVYCSNRCAIADAG
jgi:hypothetical protein